MTRQHKTCRLFPVAEPCLERRRTHRNPLIFCEIRRLAVRGFHPLFRALVLLADSLLLCGRYIRRRLIKSVLAHIRPAIPQGESVPKIVQCRVFLFPLLRAHCRRENIRVMRKQHGVHTRDFCLFVLLLLAADLFQHLHDLTVELIPFGRQSRRALDLERIDLHHALFDILQRLDVPVQFVQFAACRIHCLRRFARCRYPSLHLRSRRIPHRQEIGKVTQLCLIRGFPVFLVVLLIPRRIIGHTYPAPIFTKRQNVNALFHPL